MSDRPQIPLRFEGGWMAGSEAFATSYALCTWTNEADPDAGYYIPWSIDEDGTYVFVHREGAARRATPWYDGGDAGYSVNGERLPLFTHSLFRDDSAAFAAAKLEPVRNKGLIRA